MLWILLEAAVALLFFVGIVWWVLQGSRARKDDPPENTSK